MALGRQIGTIKGGVPLADAPASRGLTFLRKHITGVRLTASQAILAACCACVGYYSDGRNDCEMSECSLYPWMPFGKIQQERKNKKKKKV